MFKMKLGSKYQKLVLSLGLGSLMAALAAYNKMNNMKPEDLWASCFFLSSWLVFFLPGLMERLNIGLLKDISIIFFKLWTVDLVFSAFAQIRGYGNGYTYLMDEGWFFKTTGFLRAAVVVSCIVVSTISYITKQIQRQRQKRILLARLKEKKYR